MKVKKEFEFDLTKYEGITGKLIMKVLTYREYLSFTKEVGLQAKGKDIVISDDQIAVCERAVTASIKYYIKIDLKVKRGEDVYEVKNFEDMEHLKECNQLITDVSLNYLNEDALGKDNGPDLEKK